jgi:hypothetical protein
MLHQPLRRDLRHELIPVVRALAAVEAKREGDGLLDFVGSGGRSGSSDMSGSVARGGEQDKNMRRAGDRAKPLRAGLRGVGEAPLKPHRATTLPLRWNIYR